MQVQSDAMSVFFVRTRPQSRSSVPPSPLGNNAWRDLAPIFHLVSSSSLDEELAEIRGLEDGWAGSQSIGVGEDTMARVIQAIGLFREGRLLPEPEITPNTNGTVSLEWETVRAKVHLEIGQSRANGYIRLKGGMVVCIPTFAELDPTLVELLVEILNPQRRPALAQQFSRQSSAVQAIGVLPNAKFTFGSLANREKTATAIAEEHANESFIGALWNDPSFTYTGVPLERTVHV